MFLSGTHSIRNNNRNSAYTKTGVFIATYRKGSRVIVTATLAESPSSSSSSGDTFDPLLASELMQHPELEMESLSNGLRYVILPNKSPSARFEAHLEIHAGSVDEGTDEQGIAHLVEHVTFLGSRKRESLLGTGARSNAYTDFHHTVFHVHAPERNGNTNQPMLWQVLDALAEIAFEPELLPSRIEKERKAVVAEAQMMNTIEYRVDCQLLQYLHWENALGCRFPIGKVEQVEKWSREQIAYFWGKHYFPSNATLYVVGDIDTALTKELIQQTFGRISPTPATIHAGLLSNYDTKAFLQPPSFSSNSSNGTAQQQEQEEMLADPAAGFIPSDQRPNGALLDIATAAANNNNGGEGVLRKHMMVRPPVDHHWGAIQHPSLADERRAPVSVFRHRLLQLFQLSIFCKLPIRPMTTLDDLKRAFLIRVLLSVFQFRVNARYVEGNPPFVGIELDHSDSGREGCAVSTLTITSEPKDWRGAVEVAVQEARRLQLYGVTPGELERYKTALLRDSEQLAEQADSVPSQDTLEFLMESLALGHTVLDQRQAHLYLQQFSDSINPEEVNMLSRSLLSFASHYGSEDQLLRDWEENPSAWAQPGPTVATAVVACLPAFMDASGNSTGGAAPIARGASMATTQHVDPALAAAAALGDESSDTDKDIPEGAVRFEVDAPDIAAALTEAGVDVEARPDVDVPDALLPDERVEDLMAERQPHFVSVPTPSTISGSGSSDVDDSARPGPDPSSGVIQRQLSNGIKVNIRHTDNEPKAAMVRVVAAGGRAREPCSIGPNGVGSVSVGTRTLSESGTVGRWQREQVELFCISKLINCILEADEEFICMDFHFAVGDGGLPAVLQLLHLFLEEPRWEEMAMERSKQMYISHYRSLPKSLERQTGDYIMSAMSGEDRRFRDPSPEEIGGLTLDGLREAVMHQLVSGNLEVSIVGDYDSLEDLEEAVIRYLGTVTPKTTNASSLLLTDKPLAVCDPPMEQRHLTWHLKDSDERACAYIAGPAPNRWGNFTAAQQAERIAGGATRGEVHPPMLVPAGSSPNLVAKATQIRRAHPLYASVTLGLLTEIINSRLFTTVRDSLGLTYDVSFELSLFDRLASGWFNVNVTSTPAKISEAMMASLRVLKGCKSLPITQRELQRAKRTLLIRHETDLKNNSYWLGLLTHLQSGAVPLKGVECLRDLVTMYEAATVEDIFDAYSQFDFSDGKVFTCIGTSGKEDPGIISPLLAGNDGNGNGKGSGKGSGVGNNSNNGNGKKNEDAPNVDPEAFIAALNSFMTNLNQGQKKQQ
jgi:predicted Zn-dependent peptidase